MQGADRRQIQLIWASVYMSMVSLIGTTLIVIFNGGTPVEVAGGALFIAATLAMVFNTVILLTSTGSGDKLLRFCRRMIWFSFMCLVAGGALGGVALANG